MACQWLVLLSWIEGLAAWRTRGDPEQAAGLEFENDRDRGRDGAAVERQLSGGRSRSGKMRSIHGRNSFPVDGPLGVGFRQ